MLANRIIRGMVALCAVAMFCSSIAEAQPPRGGQRGGFGGGFGGGFPGARGGFSLDRATLLGSVQVREELKMEDAQAATIEAALEAYRDELRSFRPDFEAMRNMSEAERGQMMEKMRKDGEALSKKTDEILAALLEPAQVERLDQIALQAKLRGRQIVATLKDESIRTKLGISEEQVAKLTGVEESGQKKQAELMQQMQGTFRPGGGGGDREAMRAQFEKMRAEGEKIANEIQTSAMAVLTDEQRSTLDTMKGQPFELDPRSLMGGRGGQPGGRGGPGRGQGGGRQRPQTDESI